MKTLFNTILKRIQEINFRPALEWEVIKGLPGKLTWHMRYFILPISFAIVLATFLGYLLALSFYNYSFLYIAIKALSAFCESIFTTYITILLVLELCPKMKIVVSNENIIKLLIYSFSAFWTMLFLSGLLANYKSLGSFFLFLSFYGIFPFWIGCDIMLDLPPDKKNRLLIVTLSIALVVYLLIDWSFGFALRAIHLVGMMN
jgi:hypothetical protein